MAKQYQGANKWLTNTYSDFVPTKVGDTVDEMKFAYANQADKYDKARENYMTEGTAMESLNANIGNKKHLARAQQEFREAEEIAKQRGDFENMVYDAGTLSTSLSSKYNLKGMSDGYAKQQVDEKRLLENDTYTTAHKKYINRKLIEDNAEDNIDENGNFVYSPYKGMEEMTYVDAFDTIDTKVKGWVKDGLFEKDPITKKLKVMGDLSQYGLGHIEKNSYISEQELYDFAITSMQGTGELPDSIEGEAEVAIGNLNYDLGKELTSDHILQLIYAQNTEKAGTKAYDDYNLSFENALNESIKTVQEKKGSKDYDENAELVRLGEYYYEQAIKHKYATQIVNKHDGVVESVDTFKIGDPTTSTSKDGAGAGGIEDLSSYNPRIILTGDTEKIDDFAEDLNKLKSSLPDLKSKKEQAEKEFKLGNIDEATKNKAATDYERTLQTIQSQENFYVNTANDIFTDLEGSTVPLKGIKGNNKEPYFEDLGTYVDFVHNYMVENTGKTIPESYVGDPNYDINLPYATGQSNNNIEWLQEAYLRIDPTYKFENTETEWETVTNPETRLKEQRVSSGTKELPSKEMLMEIVEQQATSFAYDEDAEADVLKSLFPDFYNKIRDNRDTELAKNYLHQNYSIQNLNTEGLTQKQRVPYIKYNHSLYDAGQSILADPNNFKNIYNQTLSEAVDLSIADYENAVFKLSPNTSPDGKMVGVLKIPYKTKAKGNKKAETGTYEQIINLGSDSLNSKAVITPIIESIKDINKQFMTNMDNLSNDKIRMFKDNNKILSIYDGTFNDFMSMPILSSKEGEKYTMPIGNRTITFIPYKETERGKNKVLTQDDNKYAEVFGQPGLPKQTGQAVLGNYAYEYNSDGTLKEGRNPRYMLITDDANTSPYTIRERNGKREVKFHKNFIPAKATNPITSFENIYNQIALDRGTSDMHALATETLWEHAEQYYTNHLNGATVQDTEQALIKKGYTSDNNYKLMSDLFVRGNGEDHISVNVKQPLLALNTQGENRMVAFFNDVVSRYPDFMITGGGRDAHNVVEGGADDSIHKDYLGMDILKNEASNYILGMSDAKLKEYGIIKILSNYNDHIHLAIDPAYGVKVTPIN